MRRETVGTTAYRLIFSDGEVFEVMSVALIDALNETGGYKPRTVWVMDAGWKVVDQESIDICWNKLAIAN